jgi:phosphoglycerol transferase MdoB-like AlkP superfamily enzyme
LVSSAHLSGISTGGIPGALLLGARYDLREICILSAAMLLLPLFPFLDPFRSKSGRRIWIVLFSIISVLTVFLYVCDVLHFDYLGQRLNASVLNFIPEGGTSALMVWQTYPVLRILLIIAVISCLTVFILIRIIDRTATRVGSWNKLGNIAVGIAVFIVSGAIIWGKINQYPLRWSDAFGLGDSRLAQLALNPYQSFFSSFSFRHSGFDERTVRASYPMMATYLGVDKADSNALSFTRTVSGGNNARPNVVLVICESFSAYKSSMWGNRLNTTPYFANMCDNGIFFDRCFTPHFGTARGVWATITGIPDVLLDKTASRNPLIVDQHSIINDFAGYDKDYFIGGSTSWANIKGVLQNNISGITIHEQGSYNAKREDVWGISDKNLFLQANEVLRDKKGPFFTVIQTSDNHRPYTIPKEDEGEFKKVSYPTDTLIKYGFQTNEELNAFRYTDFCFSKFIEAAKKEHYFSNTIFIFVGDHGIRGNAGSMLPRAWTDNALSCFHVPLLFYSPALLRPQRHDMVCSQVDILPTVAGITGIPYTNSAMGRDLLHLPDTTSGVAFYIDHDVRNIGVVHGAYMMQRNLATNAETVVPVTNDRPLPADSVAILSAYLHPMVTGFYQTAQYMLFHNKNKK